MIIDIKVKTIDESSNIWVLHPGRGKRQFDTFKQANKVFLEMPGVDIEMDDVDNDEWLRKQIRYSNEILKLYARSNLASLNRDIDSYSGDSDRYINSQLGNLKALYFLAKKGDLIIVPDKGHYTQIMIGEITDDFSVENKMVVDNLAEMPVHCRNVRWLDIEATKQALSSKLSKQLENRHAIIKIFNDELKLEIFNMLYDKFIYKDNYCAYFSGERYNSREIDGIIESLELFRFVNEANLTVEDNYVNIKINFSSPGGFEFCSKNIKAIVAVLFVTVLLNSSSLQQAKDIQIENSSGSVVEVDNAYEELMSSLTEDEFQKYREKAQKANTSIGLTANVSLRQ